MGQKASYLKKYLRYKKANHFGKLYCFIKSNSCNMKNPLFVSESRPTDNFQYKNFPSYLHRLVLFPGVEILKANTCVHLQTTQQSELYTTKYSAVLCFRSTGKFLTWDIRSFNNLQRLHITRPLLSKISWLKLENVLESLLHSCQRRFNHSSAISHAFSPEFVHAFRDKSTFSQR